MFDLAWTEILLIAVIAIIVVGPKELPGMLRAFGKTFGQVRRTAREFQSTFDSALRDAERQSKLDEVKKDLDSVRSVDPAAAVRNGLSETKSALDETVTDAPRSKSARSAGDGKADSKAAADQTPPAEPDAVPSDPSPSDGSSKVPAESEQR